ncbi:MAG: hypothetical protein R2711_05880 [Acidimicrobiales bacterium]
MSFADAAPLSLAHRLRGADPPASTSASQVACPRAAASCDPTAGRRCCSLQPLALLMASRFFGLLFLAPVSQFQNDFLKDEHGFTAPMLALFTLATNTQAASGSW